MPIHSWVYLSYIRIQQPTKPVFTCYNIQIHLVAKSEPIILIEYDNVMFEWISFTSLHNIQPMSWLCPHSSISWCQCHNLLLLHSPMLVSISSHYFNVKTTSSEIDSGTSLFNVSNNKKCTIIIVIIIGTHCSIAVSCTGTTASRVFFAKRGKQ